MPVDAFDQVQRDPNAPVRLFRSVIARQNEILNEVGRLLACQEVTSATTKDNREGRSMHAVWWNRILTRARAIAWEEGRISELKVRLYDVGSPEHPCCYIARAPQEVLQLSCKVLQLSCKKVWNHNNQIAPIDITDMQLLDAEKKPSLERLLQTGVTGEVVWREGKTESDDYCWVYVAGG